MKQAEHYLDQNKRLYLARAFVLGAVQNLSHVYKIGNEKSLERLSEAETVEEIMSVEGEFRKKGGEDYQKALLFLIPPTIWSNFLPPL